HVVQMGETLFRISRSYGVSVEQMMKWNSLPDPGIQVGQKLRVLRSQLAHETAAPAARESGEQVRTAHAPVPDAATDSDAATDPNAATDPDAAVDSGTKAEAVAKEYTVQAGDNLYGISRAHGVTVEQLQDWNGLEGTALRIGQTLRVVAPAAKEKRAAAASASQKGKSKAETASHAKPTSAPVPKDTTVMVEGKRVVITRHTVAKGESLSGIARDYNVSVANLRMWNKLASDELTVGQQLLIRRNGEGGSRTYTVQDATATENPDASVEGAGKESPAAGVSPEGERHEYVVKKGETLYSIARELEVTVAQLKSWNKIGAVLDIGQKLVYYTGK
ncbi:MAG: LysM peptidoglycan-binding domain-containing protein, partial [Bacteroidota bacterium]|nr:LysM peptidoglycan-binding domain-containing protein [Bacteroidota bacterium]